MESNNYIIDTIEKMSLIGWAMYYKHYTKEQLDSLSMFETVMLADDYDRWLEENAK